MPNILLLKRSTVAGRAPVPADLVLGELAVNVTDGKLYLKKSTSGVESIVDVTAGGMTDAELFAKVTAQDGPGSGLDADLLDGAHASAFALLAGATFTGTVTAPNFVSSSDVRLKADIAPIPDALAKVQALRGVTSIWRAMTPGRWALSRRMFKPLRRRSSSRPRASCASPMAISWVSSSRPSKTSQQRSIS